MMTPEEILKKTASMRELFQTFSHRNAISPDGHHLDDLLPHYSHMQQISEFQSEVRLRKCDDISKKIENLEKSASEFNGLLDSSKNMAKSLKYIVDSSLTLTNLINNSTRNCTLPLPRQHHEKFLKIIKNCSQVLSYKGNLNASSANWPEISFALKSMADAFKEIAEPLDSSIEEHCLLQQKTVEMLEQISKLLSY